MNIIIDEIILFFVLFNLYIYERTNIFRENLRQRQHEDHC